MAQHIFIPKPLNILEQVEGIKKLQQQQQQLENQQEQVKWGKKVDTLNLMIKAGAPEEALAQYFSENMASDSYGVLEGLDLRNVKKIAKATDVYWKQYQKDKDVKKYYSNMETLRGLYPSSEFLESKSKQAGELLGKQQQREDTLRASNLALGVYPARTGGSTPQVPTGVLPQGGLQQFTGGGLTPRQQSQVGVLGQMGTEKDADAIRDIATAKTTDPKTFEAYLIAEVNAKRMSIDEAGSKFLKFKQKTKLFEPTLKKEMAKLEVSTLKDYRKIRKGAQTNKIAYQKLATVIPKVESGRFAKSTLELRKLGAALGLEVDLSKVQDSEVLEAVSNELALRLRNPESGGGLTGNTSDKDLRFLRDSVPGLAKTPRGNAILIKMAIEVEDRKIKVARMAERHFKEFSEFGPRWDDTMAKLAEDSPLFGEKRRNELQKKIEKAGGTTPTSKFEIISVK